MSITDDGEDDVDDDAYDDSDDDDHGNEECVAYHDGGVDGKPPSIEVVLPLALSEIDSSSESDTLGYQAWAQANAKA